MEICIISNILMGKMFGNLFFMLVVKLTWFLMYRKLMEVCLNGNKVFYLKKIGKEIR